MLKKLANDAGVEVIRCGKEWGGTWGLRVKTKGLGAYNVNGFRNEAAVYKGWAEKQFGKDALKSILNVSKVEARLTYLVEELWFCGADKETRDACRQALSPRELIAFIDARLKEKGQT
jgi:uncharacterized small protein (DUF1192 family)